VHAPAAARALLGYLPEGAPIYAEMTPRAMLGFVGRLRGMERGRLRQRIQAVCERLSLEDVVRQPIGTLSKGFRRRVALAQAILHEPRGLILDEPTDGLDPNQKHEVRNLIRELASDCIVIVSTHILEEVEALCSRVIVMHRGRKLVDESPATLARRSRYHGAVNIRFAAPMSAADLERLSTLEAAESNDPDGRGWTLLTEDPTALIAELRSGAFPRDLEVSELYIERGRLDEVFRRLTAEADL
jgi:ABC-2 type transport system ATP-binding protein